MDTSIFDAYSQYYDLLYNDKNYEAETDYVDKLITSFNAPAKNILELGCGTGIHAGLLAKKGYTVHGIDRSETMLRRAIEKQAALPAAIAEKLSFIEGDVRSYESGKRFDVVISLFHVMSYMVEHEDLHNMVLTAKKHLNDNGVFIFDCWHGPAVLNDRPVSRTKSFENETVSVKRTSVPDLFVESNTVDVNFEITVQDKKTKRETLLKEVHRMRYLFTEELKSLFDMNGLDLVHAEEWLTGKPLSENTWNACYVCRYKS